MADMEIRPAVPDDRERMWEFLAIAAYEPDAEAAKSIPMIAEYLDGWQPPPDFGFVAVCDATERVNDFDTPRFDI